MKKFSKEWFENKLKQYQKMNVGYASKLTHTKGYKQDFQNENKNKKEQRIRALKELAKEKGVRL